MKTPNISVIMPVYNGEQYLRQAIESILTQTYKDFELIIINDGSTDNTESIILSYDDSRIRYVRNDTNLKLIKTLNKGLSLAKGKYIARMDADDIAVNTLFERQIHTFESDDSIDIVNISTYEMSSDGKHYRPFPQILSFNSEALKYVELFENQITHPGIMVKANLIKSFGYKDDGTVNNFEDVDLWIRMLWAGHKCVTLKERLLFYRINEHSVTRTVGNKRNLLRVAYDAYIIHKFFDLTVEKNMLFYLYGEIVNGICNPFGIDRMMKSILDKKPLGKQSVKDFYDWFNLRMFIVSLQIIRAYSLKFKLESALYLAAHANSFFKPPILKFIQFKLTNKWLLYENSNVR